MATYPSPEAAAVADVPSRFARVLLSHRLGEAASVLVAENEPPVVHYYLAVLRREGEGWRVVASSGSLHDGDEEMWVALDQPESEDESPRRGVGLILRTAPPGMDSAVLEWQGTETAIPVRNGFYIFMTPDAEPDWEPPSLIRYESSPSPTTP
jgi:hypothetical protein